MYDGVLEGLHGCGVFFSPNERLILAGEVMERVSDGGIVLYPDAHIPCHAKKGADIAEVLARWPVTYFRRLGVVWNASFIRTLVP